MCVCVCVYVCVRVCRCVCACLLCNDSYMIQHHMKSQQKITSLNQWKLKYNYI